MLTILKKVVQHFAYCVINILKTTCHIGTDVHFHYKRLTNAVVNIETITAGNEMNNQIAYLTILLISRKNLSQNI